jgi:hypothetical protein
MTKVRKFAHNEEMGSETTKSAPKVVKKESDSQFKVLSTKKKT